MLAMPQLVEKCTHCSSTWPQSVRVFFRRGLLAQVTYQHAFVYIRQLAIHLRNALQKPGPETYRQVLTYPIAQALGRLTPLPTPSEAALSTTERELAACRCTIGNL